MNKEANVIMKQYCVDHDIQWCEVCSGGICGNYFLTFCHKKKRRHYLTIEELTGPKEWILAGLKCHEAIEYDREKLTKTFARLRP
jgi:hypothetical protein